MPDGPKLTIKQAAAKIRSAYPEESKAYSNDLELVDSYMRTFPKEENKLDGGGVVGLGFWRRRQQQIAQQNQPKPEGPGFFKSLYRAVVPEAVSPTFLGEIGERAKGAVYPLVHPLETAKLVGGSMLEGASSEVERATDLAEQGATIPAAIRYLQAGIPFIGPMLGKGQDEAAAGDIRSGTGTTLGALAPFLLGSPEARASLAETGKAVATPFVEGTRRAAQSSFGLGPRLTQRARLAQAQEISESLGKYKETFEQTGRERTLIKQQNDAALQDSLQKARAEHEANVGKIDAEFQQKVTAAQSAQAEQGRQLVRRAQLENEYKRTANDLGKNVKETEARVKAHLDERWENLREHIGDVEADATPIQNAVREAEQNILQGSPESIKIFRNILRESPQLEDASIFRGRASLGDLPPAVAARVAEELGIEGPFGIGGGTINFKNLRGYYTEIGDKLAAGNLPGDVYRAMKYVQKAIDNEITKIAESKGVLPEYQDVKAAWHDYKTDFHDMSSVRQGGSPLARAQRAVDPDYVAEPFTGKARERAIATYGKYREFGANPEQAARLSEIQNELGGLAKPPGKKIPLPQKPPYPPAKIPKPSTKALPEYPASPKIPKPINPKELKSQQLNKLIDKLSQPHYIETIAPGLLTALRRITANILEKEGVQKFLTKPRRYE